jgi:hypothetical protein
MRSSTILVRAQDPEHDDASFLGAPGTHMDGDTFWHNVGAGAILGAVLTLARLLLDYAIRRGDRRLDHEERRGRQLHDAEARLERILQDRLSEADRRLERCELDLQGERVRAATLEREHERLREQYAILQAEYAALLHGQRPALDTRLPSPPPEAR